MRILTLITTALLSWPTVAADPPHSFEAKVVKIADGDTITVLLDKTQHKIRLEGIDAPEKGQAYGTKARQAPRSIAGLLKSGANRVLDEERTAATARLRQPVRLCLQASLLPCSKPRCL